MNDAQVFVGTGGKPIDPAEPLVVLMHGSGLDHRSWTLQARWLARNGCSVLAPDFPAHSKSGGEALRSIEMSAGWLRALLTKLAAGKVHLVGHSQGFLTALEFANLEPGRVASLVGVATAATIPVNPALIETAERSPDDAAKMMMKWGVGRKLLESDNPARGAKIAAFGHKVMSSNPLAIDLLCCANYLSGLQTAERVSAPCAMILADEDKMTPLVGGLSTAEILNAETEIIHECGHMLPIEAPLEVAAALLSFIRRH